MKKHCCVFHDEDNASVLSGEWEKSPFLLSKQILVIIFVWCCLNQNKLHSVFLPVSFSTSIHKKNLEDAKVQSHSIQDINSIKVKRELKFFILTLSKLKRNIRYLLALCNLVSILLVTKTTNYYNQVWSA